MTTHTIASSLFTKNYSYFPPPRFASTSAQSLRFAVSFCGLVLFLPLFSGDEPNAVE